MIFLASFEGWQSLSFHRGATHQNFNAGLEPTHRLAAAARSATAQKAPEIFNKPGPAHLLSPRFPLQLFSLPTPQRNGPAQNLQASQGIFESS